MQRKIIFEAILLIMIFASIWGILTIFPIFPEKTQFGLTIDREEKLGDLLLKSILAGTEFTEMESDTVETAIEKILDRLVNVSETNGYNYNVIILEDGMANAFAIPGGHILITTGLIEITDSPGEIAAVIAHEMGHIEEKHTISRLLKNFTVTILFSDDLLISEASRMLMSTAFDRKQEEEADLFALQLLEKAQIHPRILGTAFRHIRDESGAYNPKFEIIMSHPDIDSRIKTAYDYQVQGDFTEAAFQIDWEAVKRKVEEISSELNKE